MLRNVRLITFDIVGTLLRFKEPPVAKYVAVADQHGIDVTLKQMQTSFYGSWRQMDLDHPHFGSTTNLSSMIWWMTLVKNTFKDALGDEYDEKRIQSVASQLYNYYHSPKPYTVLEDGVDVLNKLRENPERKIGVISNFDNRLHDIIPSLGLKPYFDFIVTSEDAQTSKPDPGIFDLAATKSRLDSLEPDQILHVGDDLDKDYFGARSVCWNALLVDRWNAGYSLVDEQDVITDLRQILEK